MANDVKKINKKIKVLYLELSKLKNRSRQIINNNVVYSDRIGVTVEGGPGRQKGITAGNDIEDNFRNNKGNKKNRIKLF